MSLLCVASHKTQPQQASFSWAWVLDERPEERARGVTVDVALARFKTPKHDVTLLDAPGHRDFVPNMISGATLADAALLLVDGSPGGFEAGFMGGPGGGGGVPAFALGGGRDAASGGQTKEHAQLAKSLGVDQLAVVISKLDTCDYSQVRREERWRLGLVGVAVGWLGGLFGSSSRLHTCLLAMFGHSSIVMAPATSSTPSASSRLFAHLLHPVVSTALLLHQTNRSVLSTSNLSCCPSSSLLGSRSSRCSGCLLLALQDKTSRSHPLNPCWPAGGRDQRWCRPSTPLSPSHATQVCVGWGGGCVLMCAGSTATGCVLPLSMCTPQLPV